MEGFTMKERRFDTRKLVNSLVRLYHPAFGRSDGVMRDISKGGAAINLNSFKNMQVDFSEAPLLLRPINSDVLFPISFLRQNESVLVVKFLE